MAGRKGEFYGKWPKNWGFDENEAKTFNTQHSMAKIQMKP